MSTSGKRGSPSETVIDLDPEERVATTPAAAIVIDEDPGEATPAVVDEDADDGGSSSSLPKRARLNADGSVTLPLRHPRELQIRSASGGIRTETFEEFTFHRLVGADLKAISATSDETRPVVMMARSARVRQAVMNALFDRLDGADIADAIAVVASFFPSGRTTGR